MPASTQLARWGKRLGVGWPNAVAAEARIGEGGTVEVSVNDGAIILRPAQTTDLPYELVIKITPQRRHGETDWG